MRRRLIHAGLFVCILAPSAWVAWWFRSMPHLGTTGDDQIYLVSAKALAEGDGYRIPALPGNPYQTRFPVLYPALLSVVWRVAPDFPANLSWLVALHWLALPVFLEAARRTFRWLGFPAADSWVMMSLLAVHPAVVAAAVTVGPDLAFSAALLALVLAHARRLGRHPAHNLTAGVLSGAVYLFRTAAAPLLVAVPAWHVLRRQYVRAALFGAGMLPLALAWSLWTRRHMAGPADPTFAFYTDYFRDFLINFSWGNLPTVVMKNAGWLVEYAGTLAAFMPFSPWPWLLGAVAVAGSAALIRRTGATLYHLFAAVYAGMLVVWTGKPLLRYLLPIAPLLVAGFFYGVTAACAAARTRTVQFVPRAAMSALVAWTLLAGLGAQAAAWRQQAHVAEDEAKAYDWIRAHTPAKAVFVANKEGVIFLATGRQATTYQIPKRDWYADDRVALREWAEALPSFARSRGARYVLCDEAGCPGMLAGADAPFVRQVLARHGQQVYGAGAVTIYELRE